MRTVDGRELLTRYDAIVIGAGHNGLASGIYLARDGRRTLVIERKGHVGGMAVTDETLMPGFRHHEHANALSFHDLTARSRALDFDRLGLKTILPEAQHGICFRDGRPPILLYRHDRIARSQKSLERYSRRDARTFALLKSRANRLTGSLARTFFSAPEPAALAEHRGATEAAFEDLRLPHLGSRSAKIIIDELFETPEIRTLMYRLSMEFGPPLHEPGGDAAFLGFVLWLVGRRRLPEGGMSRLIEILSAAFQREGGHILVHGPVTAIRHPSGVVAGVHVEGIGEIEAPLVVSTIGAISTYAAVGADMNADVRREIDTFEAAPASAIGSLKFCLATAPAYRGGDIEPGINRCLQVFIGLDDPESVSREAHDLTRGLPPSPAGAVRVNSLWDPGQAPAGFQSAGADCAFPDLRRLDGGDLAGIRAGYAAAFIDMWRTYAPNMGGDAILASSFHLEDGYDRKLLLRRGSDQYRTHVEGLYLAGVSTYPGGGVHGACAWNATTVAREDLAAGRSTEAPTAAGASATR